MRVGPADAPAGLHDDVQCLGHARITGMAACPGENAFPTAAAALSAGTCDGPAGTDFCQIAGFATRFDDGRCSQRQKHSRESRRLRIRGRQVIVWRRGEGGLQLYDALHQLSRFRILAQHNTSDPRHLGNLQLKMSR
jgi:hypothetical protein